MTKLGLYKNGLILGLILENPGAPGWLSWLSVQLWVRSRSHNSRVKAHIGLCANSLEPGAHFRFCVFLSLCPYPTCALSLSLSQKWLNIKKRKKERKSMHTVYHINILKEKNRVIFPIHAEMVFEGHLASSVGRVYDSWSLGCKLKSHVGCRDYLKIKS